MWNESSQQQFLQYSHSVQTFLEHNTVSHLPESRNGQTKILMLKSVTLSPLIYSLPLFWLADSVPLQRMNLLVSEGENGNKQKLQSISDQKYHIYRDIKPQCPILCPTAYHPKHPPLLSSICHVCQASRPVLVPIKAELGACAEGKEARITPPKQPAHHSGCTHAHHTLPLHTAQDCTAAISVASPPECEQCLRVLGIAWN